MRVHWLLPSAIATLTSLMLSAPAQATRLQSWRFDVNQNRLVFTTDDSVQPRAQLLSNPT
ncbi:MAG: N-acetylmuramoyl-L-alanine amidase, partial [Leptolyngbyaceae cyanobacterium SL_7_1]|nr:N-acetylmuramoyl-L-alanine amidase [Leptolyngbyaceae cyanobacterium SL_7_1]